MALRIALSGVVVMLSVLTNAGVYSARPLPTPVPAAIRLTSGSDNPTRRFETNWVPLPSRGRGTFRDEGVAGSNPATPTSIFNDLRFR